MSFAADNSVTNGIVLDGAASPDDGGREPLSVQEIIRRHHSALLSFLRQRLRIAHDADDVAQESYIRMMQYDGSREIRSPSSMLFRIAINVANDSSSPAVDRRSRARNQCMGLKSCCDSGSWRRSPAVAAGRA